MSGRNLYIIAAKGEFVRGGDTPMNADKPDKILLLVGGGERVL